MNKFIKFTIFLILLSTSVTMVITGYSALRHQNPDIHIFFDVLYIISLYVTLKGVEHIMFCKKDKILNALN